MHYRSLCSIVFAVTGCAGDAGTATTTGRARDFLRADDYTRLVFEVDSVPGYDVTSPRLKAISDIVDKPDGLAFAADETLASDPDHLWSPDDLIAYSKAHRSLALASGTTSVHVLRLDGHSVDDGADGKVLGTSVGADILVIFVASIAASCDADGGHGDGALCRQVAEGVVFTHELGHLLGLVDNGTPMQSPHRDEAHGHHCTDSECIMSWSNDVGGTTNSLFQKLRQGTISAADAPARFDAACTADLTAVRDAPAP